MKISKTTTGFKFNQPHEELAEVIDDLVLMGGFCVEDDGSFGNEEAWLLFNTAEKVRLGLPGYVVEATDLSPDEITEQGINDALGVLVAAGLV